MPIIDKVSMRQKPPIQVPHSPKRPKIVPNIDNNNMKGVLSSNFGIL